MSRDVLLDLKINTLEFSSNKEAYDVLSGPLGQVFALIDGSLYLKDWSARGIVEPFKFNSSAQKHYSLGKIKIGGIKYKLVDVLRMIDEYSGGPMYDRLEWEPNSEHKIPSHSLNSFAGCEAKELTSIQDIDREKISFVLQCMYALCKDSQDSVVTLLCWCSDVVRGRRSKIVPYLWYPYEHPDKCNSFFFEFFGRFVVGDVSNCSRVHGSKQLTHKKFQDKLFCWIGGHLPATRPTVKRVMTSINQQDGACSSTRNFVIADRQEPHKTYSDSKSLVVIPCEYRDWRVNEVREHRDKGVIANHFITLLLHLEDQHIVGILEDITLTARNKCMPRDGEPDVKFTRAANVMDHFA